MHRPIICLSLCLALFLGCANSVRQSKELPSTLVTGNIASNVGGQNDLVFNPVDVEAALPNLRDLPLPLSSKKENRAHLYTGIIRNKTNYDVSVPAGNSSATLLIPAQSFVEYSSWARRFDLTAYYNDKPFYCMKIFANPKSYPFMCKKYDFLIEIVKATPREKPLPKRKRLKRKKAPKDEGVKALG